MPNGNSQGWRIKTNDVIIRETFPDVRPMAFDNGDNGITDRWHNPGWQNLLRRADGSQVGMWYTPESDRSISYVDIFVTGIKRLAATPNPLLMLKLPRLTRSLGAVEFMSD